MAIVYTKIPPIISWNEEIPTFDRVIENLISQNDCLEIAVGYISVAGLDKLDEWIHQYNIKRVTLIAGMYKITGIPESVYNRAMDIHKEWISEGIGAIYFVKNMEYHGKIYSFSKDGTPVAAVLGSANLSVIAPTNRQFEVANVITDSDTNIELAKHIDNILQTSCSSVDALEDFDVVHEKADNLRGVTNGEIIEISDDEAEIFRSKQTDISFKLPIKAPKYENRFSTEKKDYASSNINVCYGKGRLGQNGKTSARNWYEVQVTVSKSVATLSGYPKGGPFYVVTDDGYKFEAHTTADNYKQFTAYGKEHNDRVFGRWIKGRLVASGLLVAQDSPEDDPNRDGVVTQEMLEKAHMCNMILTKTTAKEMGRVFKRLPPTPKNKKGPIDKNNSFEQLLDVWTVHFENSESDGDE